MNLPEQAIREFQEIYTDEFGEDISYEEAAHEARALQSLFLLFTQNEQ